MTQETERRQGMFVIASFDRMFTRERKNQDGTFSKTHYVGLIIRSDTETRLIYCTPLRECKLQTKPLDKFRLTDFSRGLKCQHLPTTQLHRNPKKIPLPTSSACFPRPAEPSIAWKPKLFLSAIPTIPKSLTAKPIYTVN